MKKIIMILITGAFLSGCNNPNDMSSNTPVVNNFLYIDVHHMGKGKITTKEVAQVHKKDLMVQDKYNVSLINYWADGKNGFVYCLSRSPSRETGEKTHTENHRPVPQAVMEVTRGK